MKPNVISAAALSEGIPLVDIQDVSVDPNLPKEERIAEFVRQIKNPYCFKCGKFRQGEESYAVDVCACGVVCL